MRADFERDHLDQDIWPLGHLGQMPYLGAHGLPDDNRGAAQSGTPY
jgi:hypothetical protein